MIRHVVIWKLIGPSAAEKHEQALRVRTALEALRGNIPGMTSLEVGIGGPSDEQLADVVLISTHDSWEALAQYQTHPRHKEVAALIAQLRTERRFLDFEI